MECNILIVGVGGQGTLLASRILGAVAQLEGQDCKLSEVHGMSQRGGSVVTHVRIAEKIYSPIIAEGDADIIIAFEKLEALRWKHYAKKGGTIIVNNQEIMPMPVIIGSMDYPGGIYEKLSEGGLQVRMIDALDLAVASGSGKAVNTVMLGAMAKSMGIAFDIAEKALAMCVKERFLEMNKVALKKGYDL